MFDAIDEDGVISVGSVFVRSPYNYDMDVVSFETGLDCSADEGKTQQSFKEECDINEIVRRFGLTGELPDNPRPPMYGDFTGVMDFQTALNAVRSAEEGFMEFPAELRARFHNDPQELVEFLGDDKNREEAVKLGLVSKPVVPDTRPDVPIVVDKPVA